MAASAQHTGFYHDRTNSRVDVYYMGTRAGHFNGSGMSSAGTIVAATGATVTSGGLTVTAGGATITAGNLVVTAGDSRITAGNSRLGAVSAFGTTEPTSWIVFKAGTQPAGAIATSGGVGANSTTVQKIIAAGTINNVET